MGNFLLCSTIEWEQLKFKQISGLNDYTGSTVLQRVAGQMNERFTQLRLEQYVTPFTLAHNLNIALRPSAQVFNLPRNSSPTEEEEEEEEEEEVTNASEAIKLMPCTCFAAGGPFLSLFLCPAPPQQRSL